MTRNIEYYIYVSMSSSWSLSCCDIISKCVVRTPSFGHTDLYLNLWSVQLLMMSVFFSTFITEWWRSWMSGPYGILRFVVPCIADVFVRTVMIMLIGHLCLLSQVWIIWMRIFYVKYIFLFLYYETTWMHDVPSCLYVLLDISNEI